ncbi:unannotated protein [freshwater metagenome]|uniref:Unannotated protein n=1 Tax=freshwater metagenome TaxID=449393 RepID=A0A6J7RNC4_9ZZZZ
MTLLTEAQSGSELSPNASLTTPMRAPESESFEIDSEYFLSLRPMKKALVYSSSGS